MKNVSPSPLQFSSAGLPAFLAVRFPESPDELGEGGTVDAGGRIRELLLGLGKLHAPGLGIAVQKGEGGERPGLEGGEQGAGKGSRYSTISLARWNQRMKVNRRTRLPSAHASDSPELHGSS